MFHTLLGSVRLVTYCFPLTLSTLAASSSSVIQSIYLSIHLFICLTIYFNLSPLISFVSFPVSLCKLLAISICQWKQCFRPLFHHIFFLSLPLLHFLFISSLISLSLYTYLCLSLSIHIYLSLSPSLSLCVSLSNYLSLSVTFPLLSLFASLFASLSHSLRGTYAFT